MALIEIGTKAPSFTLADQHGERHSLKNYRGRVVVLYFYPKDETPHCTIQACQFRDHHPDFSKIDAAVLGVSPDSADSHALFVENHGLNFPLLADVKPDGDGRPAVCAAYGAWQEKTLYGRRYLGVVRTTYLIDAKGVVRRRWDRVKVTGHAPAVLAAVKELKGIAPTAKASKSRVSETKARRMTRTRGEAVRKSAGTRTKGRGASAAKVSRKAVRRPAK
jgi:peroxiredoxin Q/BCP